jgi:starvation-inducible DNA-binding protein
VWCDSASRFNHSLSNGVEEIPVQISRLPEAHEPIPKQARDMAGKADEAGTNDLLVSQVLRVNELQRWFIVTHLVDEPLVIASDE